MGLYDREFGAILHDAGGSVVNIMSPKYGGAGDGTTIDDTAFLAACADMSTSESKPDVLRLEPGRTYKFNNVALDRPLWIDARGAIVSKSTSTVGHMFRSLDGAASFIGIIGGDWRCNKAGFSSGATVSIFHLVRVDDLVMVGPISFSSGIEEGLKLYNVKRIFGDLVTFDDFANDGLQCFTQSSSADGYTGSTTRAPGDVELVQLSRVRCLNISDGSAGEGQGVAFSAASGAGIIKNVFVTDIYAKNCNRSVWFENNLSSQQAKNIHVKGVTLEDVITYGIGFVGVDRGTIDDYIVIQSSSAAAGSTTGEQALIVISGSTAVPSRDITIGQGTLVGASSGTTDYGIKVLQTSGLTFLGTAEISQCAVDVGSNAWNTVSDVRLHGSDPVCHAEQSTAQATTTGTWTAIKWGSRVFDPHTWNSSEQIKPHYPGRYRVTAADSWPTNAVGSRGLRLYHYNGVPNVIAESLVPPSTDNNTSLMAIGVAAIDPTSSEYFYAERYQNSGGDLTISPLKRVHVSVEWIGGTT